MIDTGEWGLPVLFDGRIDLQKPPGYYWAVAVVGWLNDGHVTEWVTRFPAAISGLLCTLLVYGFLLQAGWLSGGGHRRNFSGHCQPLCWNHSNRAH